MFFINTILPTGFYGLAYVARSCRTCAHDLSFVGCFTVVRNEEKIKKPNRRPEDLLKYYIVTILLTFLRHRTYYFRRTQWLECVANGGYVFKEGIAGEKGHPNIGYSGPYAK